MLKARYHRAVRALFIAPNLPTHGSGGRTRLVNIMERLAKEHDLSLVAFAAADQDPSQSPYPGAVLPTPPERPRPGGMRGRVAFYADRARPLPMFAQAMSSPALSRAITDEIERFRPDIVQIETTEMGQYLADVAGLPRVLDLQDVSSRWLSRVSRQGRTLQQRALMMLEYVKTRRYESSCARIAEVVLVTSPVERAFLSGLSGVEAIEVPNGVDTAAYTPMPEVEEDPALCVFVGPMTSEANRDGMTWFAKKVWPSIRATRPDARVVVVGARGDASMPEGIELVGPVEAVQPHLARAAVVIVPLRIGSGTRYKILEALSMERAVVSTTVGAEGIGVRDGEHIRLADDPDGFARATLDLLSDASLRRRLGAAGRAHVVPRYDWAPLVAAIEGAWSIARAKVS